MSGANRRNDLFEDRLENAGVAFSFLLRIFFCTKFKSGPTLLWHVQKNSDEKEFRISFSLSPLLHRTV